MNTPVPHITVCVCTFNRPALLESLLRALSRQTTSGQFTYSMVVVDNDAAESAQAIVARAALETTMGLRYDVEPRQNIALARNKAVSAATGEFVAMIDDDERPASDWLLTLLAALRTYRADGVLGPVIPQFDSGVPEWIIRGRFYERPRHETGYRLDWQECRTGNALVDRRLFEGQSAPFDPAFLSGEDQVFFRRQIAQGRRFVWCDEAAVQEVVPRARWRRRFLVKRAVVRGAFSRRQQRGAVWPLVHSAVAAPAYLAAMPVALILGQSAFMSCAFKCSYHCGRLFAFVGR